MYIGGDMKLKDKKKSSAYNQKLLDIIKRTAAKSNLNVPANS